MNQGLQIISKLCKRITKTLSEKKKKGVSYLPDHLHQVHLTLSRHRLLSYLYSIIFLWQWDQEQQILLLFLIFYCRSILQQTIITIRYNAIMKNTNLPNQIKSTDWTNLSLIWNCVRNTCNLKFNCYGFDNTNVLCVC